MPPQVTRDRRRLRRVGVHFRVMVPLELEVDDTTGLRDRGQGLHSRSQYCQLAASIAGQPQRESKRTLRGGNSRRAGARGQLRHHRQRNRAESCRFDRALDQSDGPATHRSNRNQHDRINTLLLHPLDDGRHRFVQQPFRAESVSDIRIVRRRGVAHFAQRHEF